MSLYRSWKTAPKVIHYGIYRVVFHIFFAFRQLYTTNILLTVLLVKRNPEMSCLILQLADLSVGFWKIDNIRALRSLLSENGDLRKIEVSFNFLTVGHRALCYNLTAAIYRYVHYHAKSLRKTCFKLECNNNLKFAQSFSLTAEA